MRIIESLGVAECAPEFSQCHECGFQYRGTVLKATFMALAELGRTLGDAKALYDPHDRNGVRMAAISKLNNEFARDELERLHQTSEDEKSKRDFRAEVVGPTNRLNDFLSSDAIRAMVAHPAPLDLRQIMDDGDILLVN